VAAALDYAHMQERVPRTVGQLDEAETLGGWRAKFLLGDIQNSAHAQ
jgi:hypothetical protein